MSTKMATHTKTTTHIPYKVPRLIALTLTQWLAVVFGGLTARALVILYDSAHKVKKQLPGGHLHAGDVVAASSVAVGATGLAGIVAAFITLKLLRRRNPPNITRHIMAFLCVFILAVAIAVTIVAGTHSASVTAAASIPQRLIDSLIAASGQSLKYLKTHVVKAYIYVIWFQFLATVIATALEYRAASVVGRTLTVDDTSTNDHTMSPRSDYTTDTKV